MKTRCWILAIGLCLSATSVGHALDTIRKTTGTQLDGRVTQMDPYKITVNRSNRSVCMNKASKSVQLMISPRRAG